MGIAALVKQALGLWLMRKQMLDFYRVHVIGAGVEIGVFAALARAGTVHELATELRASPELLDGWLSLAEGFGVLRRRGDRYTLSGFARAYLRPQSENYLGYNYLEAVAVEGAFLARLPKIMRGDLPEEPEESAYIGALASIMVEPFAFRVLERLPIRREGYSVLDVGCGHGDYLRHLAQRNPTLTGTGLEITDRGATHARERVQADGLADRVEIVQADARELELGRRFDLCLLNNNLYYFAPAERQPLFRRLAAHLKPGGQLAVQVPVRRRRNDPVIEVFHLYMLGHRGLYGMPEERDVRGSMREAGFPKVSVKPLWFGAQWKYFIGRKDAAA